MVDFFLRTDSGENLNLMALESKKSHLKRNYI